MEMDLTGGWNGVTGIEFVELTEDRCVLRVEIGDHHKQPYGIVHGGVHASIVETAASMGAAVWAANAGYPGAVGVNNSTDFIKAVREGVLIATAAPIHRGRTQQLWKVDVVDEEEGRLRSTGKVRLTNIPNPDDIGSS